MTCSDPWRPECQALVLCNVVVSGVVTRLYAYLFREPNELVAGVRPSDPNQLGLCDGCAASSTNARPSFPNPGVLWTVIYLPSQCSWSLEGRNEGWRHVDVHRHFSNSNRSAESPAAAAKRYDNAGRRRWRLVAAIARPSDRGGRSGRPLPNGSRTHQSTPLLAPRLGQLGRRWPRRPQDPRSPRSSEGWILSPRRHQADDRHHG